MSNRDDPMQIGGSPPPATTGYYGQPVVHRPHWRWLVAGYFYFGGISGAAAVIAAAARLAGDASTARVGTYVSAAAFIPCPALLILDLGRPGRFLNMLRVVRPSSPMSLGSWALTLFGGVSTLALAFQIATDAQARAGRGQRRCWRRMALAIAPLHAVAGILVAGYTGVLLAATAVPLWSKRPALLGPLFLASAMSSGAAAVAAAASLAPDSNDGHSGLRELEAMASVTEGALLVSWIMSLGPTAQPLSTGRLGGLVRHGVAGAGIALPLLLTAASGVLPRRLCRPAETAASLLSLAGVLALRFAVVEGGRLSADDPRATFAMTG